MANMPPTGRMLEDFALRIEAAERETMADMQAHRDMLALALREAQCIIGELCACHKHPEPEVTMERIQKALDFDT